MCGIFWYLLAGFVGFVVVCLLRSMWFDVLKDKDYDK